MSMLYVLIATLLHGALLTLIIQRRDLSHLDHFVFLYFLLHFGIDAVRLCGGSADLLAPRCVAARGSKRRGMASPDGCAICWAGGCGTR